MSAARRPLSLEEALELLGQIGKQAPWTRHCAAVSRVACRFAEDVSQKHDLDARLLIVGSLLHDIGRYKTQDPILHGVEGYRLLSELGHHQEAFICASHVFCGMSAGEAVLYGLPRQDFLPIRIEEQLVPVIDGVVEFDRPTTFEERCSSISRRYQADPAFLRRFEQAAERGRVLLRGMNDRFGVSLEKIAAEALG